MAIKYSFMSQFCYVIIFYIEFYGGNMKTVIFDMDGLMFDTERVLPCLKIYGYPSSVKITTNKLYFINIS